MKSIFIPALICLAACQAKESTISDQDVLAADGLVIVESQCASCNQIGRSGDSPRPDAPPLRYVLSDYDATALADDFWEHVHVGHPDMPDFDFGPKGTDAVLAYLKSIQEKP